MHLIIKNTCLFTTALAIVKAKSHDSVFIRYAHSQFNHACQTYRLKHGIDYDWEKLVTHDGFADEVGFNQKYIDAPLTKRGIQQCHRTKQILDLSEFDYIMVSPHKRALQTVSEIIKVANNKNKVQVIVEPLIASSLSSSCDIGDSLQMKMKEFPHFNFKKFTKLQELWFIRNLDIAHKKVIHQQINEKKVSSYRQKQLLILNMMKKNINQDCVILRHRAWQIKKLMNKIRQKHEKMLVLTHYYIIQYINSKYFNQGTQSPIQEIDFKKCSPYCNCLEELMKYK